MIDFLNLVIVRPFAWVFLMLYQFSGESYGLSLLLFALLAKLVLLPFQVKGKKSMMRMSRVSPKLQQLQKQYGKDRVRYNEEMQKLYKEENISPFGGCLWTLLPLPVMIALYTVIRKPLSNLMNLSAEQIQSVRELIGELGLTIGGGPGYEELAMARHISEDFSYFSGKIPGLLNIDFHFLGIDLSQIPNFRFWQGSFSWAFIGLLLIPVLSGLTAFLSSRVMMKTNSAASGNATADRVNRQMMFTMPLISIYIGFIMPAGLGVYWIANNLLTSLQELLVGRRLKEQFDREEARREELARLEAEREKQLRAERIAQREAEAKANKGKKKTHQQQPKKRPAQAGTTDKGKIGTRPYARGRAYEPERYAAGRQEDAEAPDGAADEPAALHAGADMSAQNYAPADEAAGEITGYAEQEDVEKEDTEQEDAEPEDAEPEDAEPEDAEQEDAEQEDAEQEEER